MATTKIRQAKRVGLSDIFFMPLTKDDAGQKATYGEAVHLGNSSEANFKLNYVSATLEAEDGIEENYNEIRSAEIDLSVSQIPEANYAAIFGHKVDEKGGIVVKTGDAPVYGALAFRAKLSKVEDGKEHYAYYVYYKVKLTPPDIKAATMKNESLEFQLDSGIKGTAIPRASDGLLTYRIRTDNNKYEAAVVADWFTTPKDPTFTTV